MFAALIYSRSNSKNNKLSSLWWFYKLIYEFNHNEIVFFADNEEYFSDPDKLCKDYYHGLGKEEQIIYRYCIPTYEKLSQYKRVIFNSNKISNRITIENEYKKYQFKSDLAFEVLENLNFSYSKIEKLGIKPNIFLFNSDREYIQAFCEKKNIYYISTELGPFRNWPLNTGIFNIGGIYNKKNIDTRYEQFKNELMHSYVPIYKKNEIILKFFNENYEESKNNAFPEYDLGIAFPYSVNQYAFNKLKEIAFKFKGNVIGRLHPTDPERNNINNIILDESAKSIDFIKKCKRIVTFGSNITLEALLLDKIVFDFGNNPFSGLAHNIISDTIEQSCRLLKLNFYIFSYVIPYEFCYNKEYILWRLSNPSEIEIYKKNIEYWNKNEIKKV